MRQTQHVGIVIAKHERIADQVRKRFKGLPVLVEISIDVGVVQLHRSDQPALRPVMQKFRARVKIGTVVLVALHHEMPSRSQAVADILIGDDSAHEIARITRAQQVDEQPRRGGLAVCACNDEGAPVAQEKMCQCFWKGKLRQPAFPRGRRLHMGGRARVADYDQVGFEVQVIGVVSLVHHYVEGGQVRAHGRIYPCVRTLHTIAGLFQQTGQ